MYVLLQNLKLVHTHTGPDSCVLIRDGIIQSVGCSPLNLPDAKVIDCGGRTLLPGFVDLHAHFRDPGLTYKEDLESGSRAAVHGGYTTVNLMANTKPICWDMETVRYVRQTGDEIGLCSLHQTAAITQNFDGESISHIPLLENVKWLSDDGIGVASTQTMYQAMLLAKEHGIGVMLHEEDPALTQVDMYLAEELMTFRDVKLAMLTGCKTHFCHVSTRESLDHILAAKRQCDNITCEVSPHHLVLNDQTDYAVAPPLRSEEHRQYLLDCVRNGLVDAIATDHAPHTPQDKANGANGMTGIEIAFAALYTHLVLPGHLSLERLSQLMSENPAHLMSIPAGKIAPGYHADLVLVDTEASFVVEEDFFVSKGKNTPFIGQTLYGEVYMTIKKGEVVYEKG